MTQVLDDLVALLSLERIEENLFRGGSQDLGFRQLFGGQALGQSVSAASQTVDPDRHVHSVHGYFLRPGDASQPVVYQVKRIRDGGSFSTRNVMAIQKGQPIFTCNLSFQYDEQGFAHQEDMPQVPDPETLPSEAELLDTMEVEGELSERRRLAAISEKPIEIRPVVNYDALVSKPSPAVKYIWFKAAGALSDDQLLQRFLLAYASDFNLLTTSLLPHGASVWQESMQVASLDHALWIHCNLRMDDWLLYAMDSPWAGNARGFARGRIYDRQGKLVASVAQEGLIRIREDWR